MNPATSVRSKDSYRRRILKKRGEILRGLSKELSEGINRGSDEDQAPPALSHTFLDQSLKANRGWINREGGERGYGRDA